MTIIDVLHWTAGLGWIVLSGGADLGGEVRATVLRRAKAAGGVAYIGFNEDSSDDVLDDMDDLGAPSGYLVNVAAEDDDTIREQLEAASVIVIDNSVSANEWRGNLLGAALDGMRTALDRGAIILAEGAGAAAFGEYLLAANDNIEQGLSWLQNTLILPGTPSLQESEVARYVLDAQPNAIAIGIGVGSALALGAEGQIEIWGNKQVAIALGRDYQN